MDENKSVNQLSGRDETLARAFYSHAGTLPTLHVAQFDYSAPRQGMLHKLSAKLGAKLRSPLPSAHQALLAEGAEQSPEDLALVERMASVQCETVTS